MDEDEERFLILDDLIRFADHNKSFNRKFVDDCFDFRERKGFLSLDQLWILHKIFKENKVDEFIQELYP